MRARLIHRAHPADQRQTLSITPLERTALPSPVSTEAFETVCQLISTGMSMRKACEQAGVNKGDLYYSMTGDSETARARSTQYAQALSNTVRAMAVELLELSDRAIDAKDNVQVQGLRLAVDTRRWLLSKIAPKQYGDRVDVDIGGAVTLQLSKDDAQL